MRLQTTKTKKASGTTRDTNPFHRILISALLVLSILAGASGTAMAGPGDDDDGPVILQEPEVPEDADPHVPTGEDTPTELRRYTVRFLTFTAVDETGPDWTGSDEMQFVLGMADQEYRLQETQVYGDVDSDETHAFTMADGCVTPGGCTRTSPGVTTPGFVVATAVERDGSVSAWDTEFAQALRGFLNETHIEDLEGTWVEDIYNAIQDLYNSVVGDDEIGAEMLSFETDELERSMPWEGSAMERTMDLAGWGGDWLVGGDGHYQVRVQIRRVDDAETPASDGDAPQNPSTGSIDGPGGIIIDRPHVGDVAGAEIAGADEIAAGEITTAGRPPRIVWGIADPGGSSDRGR